MEIIATIALCYIAAGIYVMLVFDHADDRRGLENLTTIGDQAHTVFTWPMFLHFIANEDEYLIVIDPE